MQQGTVKSYNKMKNEFFKKFRSEIVPIAKKQEQTRKKYLIIAILGYIFFWTITAIGAYYAIPFLISMMERNSRAGRTLIDFIGLIIAGITAPFLIQRKLTKKIEKDIKKRIMPSVCRCISNLTWHNGFYENENIIATAKLINDNYGKAEFDDVFLGEYRDVKIDIVEGLYLPSEKSVRYRDVPYFQGVFIVLDMNKKFEGHTIIKPESLVKFEPYQLRKTTLEDVKFEKKYDVYTDNEIEARYLITTSFMDRLNEMKTAFKGKKVSCAFYDKKLIIAFDNPFDTFSVVSLFRKTEEHKQYFQMFDEFLSIVKLIDYFKLNEKTGL